MFSSEYEVRSMVYPSCRNTRESTNFTKCNEVWCTRLTKNQGSSAAFMHCMKYGVPFHKNAALLKNYIKYGIPISQESERERYISRLCMT